MSAPDAIVVGAGPAGVSAAWALLERGARVLQLEGGGTPRASLPPQRYAEFRASAAEQWRLLVGARLEALAVAPDASPKFRVPEHARMFAAWSREFATASDGFVAQGMLAVGGMTNAWGGGVSRFDEQELAACGLPAHEMAESYARVERRIGVSGDAADDLAPYFGPSAELQPATPLVGASSILMAGYRERRARAHAAGLRLGRSRLALVTRDHGARRACAACNFCLYGCERHAVYSAADEVAEMRARAGYALEEDVVVERLERSPDGWRVLARRRRSGERVAREAPRVLLAGGALVSARLALDALGRYRAPVAVHCHPTAGVGMIVPRARPARVLDGYAIGQLDYLLDGVLDAGFAYGSVLPVDALPLSSLLGRAPLGRAAARVALRRLTPLLLAANVFLPSTLARCRMELGADGVARFAGGHAPEADAAFARAARVLRRGFAACGAWLLPGSFAVVEPGADLHYGGTIAHSAPADAALAAAADGTVRGLDGVHVVDGAAVAPLPAKPPTLTFMANADRIARALPLGSAASR